MERRLERVPTPYQVGTTEQIFASVDDIDVDAWEHVRESDDIFMDLRLLRAIESTMADTCRFRYLLYRNTVAEPVAIAVLCTFTIDIGVLAEDAVSRTVLGWLRGISRKLVDYRILFCGLPLSACQSSLRFAPGADPAQILALLDKTLQRLAKQDRASVIVLKEFTDEEMPALEPLSTLGYRQADSLPTNLVHLTSNNFEGYLMDAGHKRRTNIRQSMKKFAKAGLEFITTSDLPTIERLFTTDTYHLYESVLNRSKTQLEHLPQSFFIEMARQLPDCCEFQFAMQGDQVRAFCISLWAGHEYRPLFMGFDAEFSRQADVYFNMAFRTIGDGAGHGSTVVEVGQNSDYFKRTKLGAVQSRRSLYVRGGNAVMSFLLKLLFKQFFPARPLYEETAGE